MSYIVTAPLAVIADSVGHKRYYYEGAQLPDDLPAEECQRLADMGFLASTDAPAAPARAAEGEASQRPAQIAAKNVWVDYAIAHGMDQAEAEAMSKQQLLDRFGGSDNK